MFPIEAWILSNNLCYSAYKLATIKHAARPMGEMWFIYKINIFINNLVLIDNSKDKKGNALVGKIQVTGGDFIRAGGDFPHHFKYSKNGLPLFVLKLLGTNAF